MAKNLCPGDPNYRTWESAGDRSIDHWSAKLGERPSGVKRKRLKCPKCGRKVLSSVRFCDDGCCVIHTIPPHKPKGWWKKKKKKKSN